MKKNNAEPTVPPKHVRRAEFYKRLRESSLSQEVDKKAVEIESPNNQEYKERAKKRDLETRRQPFVIDNDKFYGR